MATSPKWQEFCRIYVADKERNATRAYRTVYNVKSDEVAAVCASRLLRKANVDRYIKELEAKAIKKQEITAEKVVKEIAKSAFLNPKAFFDDNGAMRPLKELSDEVAATIAGLDLFEQKVDGEVVGVIKKIKFVDKNKSLEMLGRYLKMFTDKQEVTVMKSLADVIKEVDGEC